MKLRCLLFAAVCASIGRSVLVHGDDADWQANESKLLANINQLTHPGMGFTEAGEGYFSPDSKRVIFQAVPDGVIHRIPQPGAWRSGGVLAIPREGLCEQERPGISEERLKGTAVQLPAAP